MNERNKFLTQAALIAAIYLVLVMVFQPISFGEMQVRISEMLTILPYFTPAAIPGLFIGCLLGNFIGGAIFIDVVFGSLATLIAAILTYVLRKYKYLAPMPPVLINAVVVGLILKYAYQLPLPLGLQMLFVGLGQIISCYILGYPLLLVLEPYRNKIFK